MKKIFLIIFIFIPFQIKSQINLYQNYIDTTTIYDLLYLDNKIHNDKEVLNNLTNEISTLQNNYYNEQLKLKTIENNLSIYKKLLINYIKFYYIFKLNNSNKTIFLYTSTSLKAYYSKINFLKLNIKYIKRVTSYIKLLKINYTYRLETILKYKQTILSYLNNYQEIKINSDSTLIFYYNQSKILQQNEKNIRKLIEKDYEDFLKVDHIIKNNTHNTKDMSNTNSIENNIKFDLPLLEPILISSFGEHSHSIYKNIKVKNDGIDITSKIDTIVKSVEEGRVIAIIKLKNNGYSVILKHNYNYFSVYSNLNLVMVKQNQKVLKKQPIGTISPKTSKYSFSCLNIQLWYNTTKLDPQKYINITNE